MGGAASDYVCSMSLFRLMRLVSGPLSSHGQSAGHLGQREAQIKCLQLAARIGISSSHAAAQRICNVKLAANPHEKRGAQADSLPSSLRPILVFKNRPSVRHPYAIQLFSIPMGFFCVS